MISPTGDGEAPGAAGGFGVSPLQIGDFVISNGQNWNAERRAKLNGKLRSYCLEVGYAADCITVDIEIVGPAENQIYPCAIVGGSNETPHPESRPVQSDDVEQEVPVFPGDRILYQISCFPDASAAEGESTPEVEEVPGDGDPQIEGPSSEVTTSADDSTAPSGTTTS